MSEKNGHKKPAIPTEEIERLKSKYDISSLLDELHLDASERLQAVLDNVVDGIITIDELGIITSFNQASERIFGYQANEVIGQNVKMLMPDPYQHAHDGYIQRYKDTKEARIIGTGRQVEGLRKDGSTFPLELAVSESQLHNRRFFTGIVRDISEQVEAAQALHSSANRLRTVLDNVVDGIITINKRGIIDSFNIAAQKIFGYEAHEVIGKNVSVLMPEPYAEEHDGYLHNYLNTHVAKIIGIGREVTGRRKNGTTFPMDLAVSEIEIDGELMFSGIVRDITERKQMEMMKNEFISTVSHELRTPLTSIRGSLDLVLGGAVGALSEPMEAMLRVAANNTERLLLLINDILDIQKIESGKMAFRFAPINIKDFVLQSITDNEAYANQYGVRFVIKPIADDPIAFADKDRLMQVMANLLSNAAKFSPPDNEIEISATRREHAIRISVTDHGPGIPEEFQPQVFEKFTQADSTDSRNKGGTGLGLSISRLIIEKHGGHIDFVSRSGIGTTFFFDLPELITSTNDLKAPPKLTSNANASILIVEDDPDIAALLQRMLAEEGYNSDVAYTASEARARIQQDGHKYKAMTLDIVLPDEDGLEMLASLRADANTANLPVVVVSVKSDEARRNLSGGAMDVIDWLAKPIDQSRLLNAIHSVATENHRPKVLHVEDEQDVHKIVSLMLRDSCELVWTTTVEASREALENEDFDLVLLDIGLPDGTGTDLLDLIEKRVRPPRVVIFSALDVDESISCRVSNVLVKAQTDRASLMNTITSAIRTQKRKS